MDARRLGHRPALPHALLAAATPAYLTDTDWDAAGEDWLEQALAYTAAPCNGVAGPLTRIRPRPARSRRRRSGSPDSGSREPDVAGGPVYRLADYLHQYGRRHRGDQFPPAAFWAASADHAQPGDQAALGDAARARGLYRDAAQLYKPNLRDLERPYLVADLGGRRHSVVGVLATWCYPARRRRPPQRSIWRPNRYHVAEVAGSFWLHLQCHIRHFPWSGAFLGDTPT
jgi:hypothetical protein